LLRRQRPSRLGPRERLPERGAFAAERARFLEQAEDLGRDPRPTSIIERVHGRCRRKAVSQDDAAARPTFASRIENVITSHDIGVEDGGLSACSRSSPERYKLLDRQQGVGARTVRRDEREKGAPRLGKRTPRARIGSSPTSSPPLPAFEQRVVFLANVEDEDRISDGSAMPLEAAWRL
jgi:hypothetical protein